MNILKVNCLTLIKQDFSSDLRKSNVVTDDCPVKIKLITYKKKCHGKLKNEVYGA